MDVKANQVFLQCDRFLSHHQRQRPRDVFLELAASSPPSEWFDGYGKGELIEDFEKKIAALLGKESAVFLPSGTMAQVIALRIWCDRRGLKSFGLHATSHLENHEQHAYKHLHGLDGVLLGEKSRLLSASDVEKCTQPLGAVILELPHRELAGTLPEFSEVEKMAHLCRERNTHFHLDGARLWESGPYYKKSYAEIAAPFASVYVSFYKGLGGIAGAVLAGPADFIAEAKIWQRRQGGNLVALYPYVISARAALATRLPKMAAYHRKAIEIAAALGAVTGISVEPAVPQTNMMMLTLKGNCESMEAASLKIAAEKKVALFRRLEKVEGGGRLELAVGDATLEFATAEIAQLFGELMSGSGPDRLHAQPV